MNTQLEAYDIAILPFESKDFDSLEIKLEVVLLIGLPEMQMPNLRRSVSSGLMISP